MTVERFPLADVPAMIADGRLIDAKTIIGLTLALRRRVGRRRGSEPSGTVAEPAAAVPGPVPPLPLDVEEYLTWLAVERGRSPNTLVGLPPRPRRPTGPGCRREGLGARRRDGAPTSTPTSARCGTGAWRRRR